MALFVQAPALSKRRSKPASSSRPKSVVTGRQVSSNGSIPAGTSRLTATTSFAAETFPILEEAQGPEGSLLPPETTSYATLEEAQPAESDFHPPETPKRTNVRPMFGTPPVDSTYPESWRFAEKAATPVPSPPPVAVPPDKQALDIGLALMPSMMACALNMDKFFDSKGYRAHLDKVLRDAGAPTDPVEIMLIEQLVMAHFRAAQLQAEAGQAQGMEAKRVLNSASARLLGEFRMHALALQAYRAARQKSVPTPQDGQRPQFGHPTGN